MSKSDPTFNQATHTLKLISDQNLDAMQMKILHYCLPSFLLAIKRGIITQNLMSSIATARKVEILKHVVDFDARPSIPAGWDILPDAEQLPNRMKGVMEFDLIKVGLHIDEDQRGGKVTDGHKLRKKLEGFSVYGAPLLDFYMANQHLIPEQWKKDEKGHIRYIFFWGTIYRHPSGQPFVCCVYWHAENWNRVFQPFITCFGDSHPSAVHVS